MDRLVRAGAFRGAANIYAADIRLSEGDNFSGPELTELLRMARYQESDSGKPGTFHAAGKAIEIVPAGSDAVSHVQVRIDDKQRILQITVNGAREKSWDLGTPLITNLSTGREKRQMVSFADIPKVLVHAVESAEDKHFFQHSGLDLPRIAKAAYIDFHSGRKEQGASTLTMQLVRGLWLGPQKSWRRKLSECAMTLWLERRWSKEAIFETYANQIYLGRQAAYSVHGFAQASQLFFGKDIRDLTLPEAALLAGMVQRPSYYNPYRNPSRATERRNLVLALMKENGYINDAQYNAASRAPLELAGTTHDDGLEVPYFLDRINDELRTIEDADEKAKNVYTTIDLNLQRIAREAVNSGMQRVDKLMAKRLGKSGVRPEAALIAIDPHTGEIKAMVGGRDYGRSQFNRVFAKRPPGSVFKPFVYAAALNTAITGGAKLFTPASTVNDSPTTFWANGKPYVPSNYKHEIFGTLTFRQALAKSDNVAAVKVAQQVGYGTVVAMARRAGFNEQIAATPSIALGSYGVTPLEVAGAYTLFANEGRWVKPRMVSSITDESDGSLRTDTIETHPALDYRVAYLMVSMLQEVMRSGTAAGVRSLGFTLPAAGKTGTSHDGWFAGFTSKLLCVVWVGFDDYRELDLEGAKSALPIWTEFMKRASQYGAYRNPQDFKPPSGVVSVRLCNETGLLAGSQCTSVRSEIFIEGTQPVDTCNSHAVVMVESAADGLLQPQGRPPAGYGLQ